ncbi:zinc-binding dehydrogenase [Cytophagaceae bacterium ABcell3]|nr:zinc-binding dehydrogenase [Cytophagaceae bacterium ABcell3]
MKRKVFLVRKTGSLKNLACVEEQLDPPAPDEVTISVKTIGLNYADIFTVLGLYKAAPKNEAFVPGLEFSGLVEEVGSGVERFKKGDKVMGVTKFGAYADHLNISSQYIELLPEGWSFEEGAAFLVQALTAYYALKPLGNVQKGHAVLIHSGAGGVGILANRIARKLGAYTIGVVGNHEKIPLLQKEKYGAGVVRSDNFKQDVLTALDGRELNLVLETTGGKYLKMSYDLLAPTGRLIAYGSARYTPSGDKPNYLKLLWKFLTRPKIDPHAMITQNKAVMGFNLIWIYERVELMHTLLQEIMELNLDPPYIGQKFSFEELPDALRVFRDGKTTGKLIVDLSS